MNRRTFCALASGGAVSTLVGLPVSCTEAGPVAPALATSLPRAQAMSPEGVTLTAAEGGDGLGSHVWTINGTYPGPTLRSRQGGGFDVRLENRLPEETILHWHGLNVPESADGHPRLAIRPGDSYHYEFEVRDRPGTYWYHPHPHGRTAPQTYRGMTGFFIVEDPDEAELGIPAADREIELLLQDRRLDESGQMVYAPFGPDTMFGYMGEAAFANGAPDAQVAVQPTTYRFRILNGSNARVFQLGLSDGAAVALIGSDGGLLEAPHELTEVMLGNAERVDLVIDFSRYEPGTRIALVSRQFDIPGMMGRGMGMGMGMGPRAARLQGSPLELLTFVVEEPAPDLEPPAQLASGFGALPDIGPERAVDRVFEFNSMMMRHSINGRFFEMNRIDFEIPLGDSEIWAFRNPSALPHPVHVHAGQFRVLSRTGGRGRVFPWEEGLKDTVLLFPGEEVRVAVRFRDYRGRFLLHCHNLEHEDAGMMLNFAVV